MTRLIRLLILSIIFLIFVAVTMGQSAPTLTPPTPIPVQNSPVDQPLRTVSTIAQIQERGILRVGILFNEPQYGELSIRGDIVGFDADIARALAESWGVEVEFIQVTRLNRIEMLQSGTVDLLIASMVHRRELDAHVEFSQSYRVSSQSMLVRASDEITNLPAMMNRRVGYVLGTESEIAALEWQATLPIPLQLQSYLTLDQAYVALFANEIDGVIGREEHLLRVSANQPDAITILSEPIQLESFAIAMLRQDAPLRQLVNQTLQYLSSDGTLEDLHETYFPGTDFSFDAIPLASNIGDDAPTLSQYDSIINYPTQYTLPRVRNNNVLRVAGLNGVPQDTEAQRRITSTQQNLVNQIAQRLGVQVQTIDGDPITLLETGQADIAVGIPYDWQLASRVDFSQPYMLHGDRLMVRSNSQIQSFNELRGRWVGVMNNDNNASERAQEWADSVNASIRIFLTSEQDAAFAMLVENNADVIFADSLKLFAHLEQNPNDLVLTSRWYSRNYLTLGIAENDVDFRLTVNYILQDMMVDGTLAMITQSVTPPNESIPQYDFWAGTP